MTSTVESPSVGGLAALRREQVEDFLYSEAELLDDWDLDGWVALFTDDGRYLVPCPDHPGGDPSRDLVPGVAGGGLGDPDTGSPSSDSRTSIERVSSTFAGSGPTSTR